MTHSKFIFWGRLALFARQIKIRGWFIARTAKICVCSTAHHLWLLIRAIGDCAGVVLFGIDFLERH